MQGPFGDQAFMTPADRRLFTIAGAVLLLIVALSVAFGPSNAEESAVPSTYSSTSGGARAAYLLLSDLGYDVRRWEEPPAALDGLGPDTLLILAEPTDAPTKPERDALWRFLSKGGRILFCGARLAVFFPEREVVDVRPGGEWTEFTPAFPSPASRDAHTVVMQPQAYWGDPDPSQLRLYGGEHSAVVVDWRIGEGDLLWWGSATPLTNGGMTRADNLRLFLNSVTGSPGREVAIDWDEYFHGQRTGLWGYFQKTPLPWALLPLGLVTAGVLFTFSRRSGPIVPAPVVSRLSPLEFVETMGGLYERAGAFPVATGVPYRRLRFELARALGLPAAAGNADLAKAAGERLGLDAAGLAEALQSAAQASEDKNMNARRALALVQRLEDFSLQLRTPKPASGAPGLEHQEKT
jgi:Domain of unknown function (DUF4350)